MRAVSGWNHVTGHNKRLKQHDKKRSHASARSCGVLTRRRNKLPNSWTSRTEHLDGHLSPSGGFVNCHVFQPCLSGSYVCWTVWVMRHCILTLPFVALVLGHPRPPRYPNHSVPLVSLPGPTGVLPMPRQDGIGYKAPTLVVALCKWWWICHADVAHTRILQAYNIQGYGRKTKGNTVSKRPDSSPCKARSAPTSSG